MQIGAAAAGEATRCSIVHAEREIGYLIHFRRNIKDLREIIEQLTATRNDVQRLVDTALVNSELIKETVQTWLAKTETVPEEAKYLIDQAGHVNSWFKGWCCTRFSLGRKAQKNVVVIQRLLDERSLFGTAVSDPKPFQAFQLVTSADFDAFASREVTTNRVLDALSNGEFSLIGVWGMPGVGKTMLIEAIYKKVKNERLFDEVVMLTVSQNPDVEKIRADIAMQLDLKLNGRDTPVMQATRLLERLSQGKKVLIVLDDIWERLALDKVGIPYKNENRGCKVLFTTRDRHVCGQMESDLEIEVTILEEDDSWRLFQKRSGDVIDNSILPEVAKDIANECKGLPLAISTLARALRGRDKSVWNDALRQLRRSNFTGSMKQIIGSRLMEQEYIQYPFWFFLRG